MAFCSGGESPGVHPGSCHCLWPLCPHTSAGAASPGSFLAVHVLQLYDFYLRVPPLTPNVERHVGVLKQPMVSLRVALIAWAGPHSRVPPRSRWGVHGHSHGSRSCHRGDGLAVTRHATACGRGRWVPRSGPPGASAVPVAGAGMPFSRNFKSVSARSVGRRPRAFSGGVPVGLLALPSRGQGPRVQAGMRSRVRGWGAP